MSSTADAAEREPAPEPRPGGPSLAAVVALEDQIAAVMGELNGATSRLVGLIAEAIDRDLWCGAGIRSVEHWVTWRAGVSPARARRLVQMAKALRVRPATAAAFAEGALTEDQTSVICRRGRPAQDAEVTELARMLLVPQIEHLLRRLPAPEPADETEPPEAPAPPESAPAPPERRDVDFGTDDEGWWCRMHLPTDEGAVIEAALSAARARLFSGRHPDVDPDGPGARRISWADAALAMAEAALDHLGHQGSGRAMPTDRHQVLYHYDIGRDDLTPHGTDGPVPDALRRLLTCDAVVRLVAERDGQPVWLSDRARIVPLPLRRLIERRDRTCRVPGCGQRRFLHMHHLVHVEDGGATSTDNLIALCAYHHRAHHRGRLGIEGNPIAGLRFLDHFGRRIERQPPPPPSGAPPNTTAPYTPPLGERVRWGDIGRVTEDWNWN